MKNQTKAINDIRQDGSEKSISWVAPEYIHQTKNKWWYISIALIGIVLAGIFFWLKRYEAIAIAILAPVVLMLMTREKNREIKYTVAREGIGLNDQFYPFDNFRSFWVVTTPPTPKLYLETTKKLSPHLTIFLMRVNIDKVRDLLKEHLPEQEGNKEILHDQIARIFRF